MGMQDFTRHQQGIIKRYYENIDGISLQKLSELVTELYLAEGKKREKLWKTAVSAMQKLEQAQFQQQHDFGQREDDGEQQDDSTDEPASVFDQINGATQDA